MHVLAIARDVSDHVLTQAASAGPAHVDVHEGRGAQIERQARSRVHQQPDRVVEADHLPALEVVEQAGGHQTVDVGVHDLVGDVVTPAPVLLAQPDRRRPAQSMEGTRNFYQRGVARAGKGSTGVR